MTIGEFPNPTIEVDGQEIGTVDRFTNLGSIVDVSSGTDADVKSRSNKARHASAVLKPIWKSRRDRQKFKYTTDRTQTSD